MVYERKFVLNIDNEITDRKNSDYIGNYYNQLSEHAITPNQQALTKASLQTFDSPFKSRSRSLAGASQMRNMLSNRNLESRGTDMLMEMSLNMVMRQDSSAAHEDFHSLSPSRNFQSSKALVNNLNDEV
jgi:hypothetical protein